MSARDVAKSMAASCGPSQAEAISRGLDGSSYGPSVKARAVTAFAGDWDERVRIYREGLALGAWTSKYPGLIPAEQSNTKPMGFRCPANFIFGMQDIALDPRIVLAGIEEYFMPEASAPGQRDSLTSKRILRLPQSGHWSMLEPEGHAAIKAVMRRAIA